MPIDINKIRQQQGINRPSLKNAAKPATVVSKPAVQNEPAREEQLPKFDPNFFNVWSRVGNFTPQNSEQITADPNIDTALFESQEASFFRDYQKQKQAFDVLPDSYNKYLSYINDYNKTKNPQSLKAAALSIKKLQDNVDLDLGFNIKTSKQYKALKKDISDKATELQNLATVQAMQKMGVNPDELFKRNQEIATGKSTDIAKQTHLNTLKDLGMEILNKSEPGSIFYNDDTYNELVKTGKLSVNSAYTAAKAGMAAISFVYDQQAKNIVKQIDELDKKISTFPKNVKNQVEFKTKNEFDAGQNIINKRNKLAEDLKGLEANVRSTPDSVFKSDPVMKDLWNRDIERSTGTLSNKQKAMYTTTNILNSILTGKCVYFLNKVGAISNAEAHQINDDLKPVQWLIGKDPNGKPIYSNQMVYTNGNNETQVNWRGVFETGSAVFGDMVYTAAVTKGLASGLARSAKLISSDVRLTESARKTLQGLTADKLVSNSFTSRALTFPAVYLTTYPKIYFNNLSSYKNYDKAAAASNMQTMIESFTESIIPDISFFSKAGAKGIGEVLTSKEIGKYFNKMLSGKEVFNVAKFKTLGKASKIALKNFVQEGVIEEQAAYLANKEMGDYYKGLDPNYKDDQTFGESLIDSALGMLVSSVMGFKGNITQAKHAYSFNMNEPESLINFQWNIATAPNAIKKEIQSNSEMNDEQKVKAYQLVDKYKEAFDNSVNFITKPSDQTLGKDVNKVYTHFGLNLLMQAEEGKILEKQLLEENTEPQQTSEKLEYYKKEISKIENDEKEFRDMSPEQQEEYWFGLYEKFITSEESLTVGSALMASHIKDLKSVKDSMDTSFYEKYKNALNKAYLHYSKQAKNLIDEIYNMEEPNVAMQTLPPDVYKSLASELEAAAEYLPVENRIATISSLLDKLRKSYAISVLANKNKTKDQQVDNLFDQEESESITPPAPEDLEEIEEPETQIINPNELITEEEYNEIYGITPIETEDEKEQRFSKIYDNPVQLRAELLKEIGNEETLENLLNNDNFSDPSVIITYGRSVFLALQKLKDGKSKYENSKQDIIEEQESNTADNITDNIVDDYEDELITDEDVVIHENFKTSAEVGFTTSGQYNSSNEDISTPSEKRALNFYEVIDASLNSPNPINKGLILSNSKWFKDQLGEEKINEFATKVIEMKSNPETVNKEELMELIGNLLPEDSIEWYLSEEFKGKTPDTVKNRLLQGVTLVITDNKYKPLHINEKGTRKSTTESYKLYRRIPIIYKTKDGVYYTDIPTRDSITDVAQGIFETIYNLQEKARNFEEFQIPINIVEVSKGFDRVNEKDRIRFSGDIINSKIVDNKVFNDGNILMTDILSKQDINTLADIIYDYQDQIKADILSSYLNKITYLRKGKSKKASVYAIIEKDKLKIVSSEGHELTKEAFIKYLGSRRYNFLLKAINDDFAKISIKDEKLEYTPYNNYGEYLKNNVFYYDTIRGGNRKLYYTFSDEELPKETEAPIRKKRERKKRDNKDLFSSRGERLVKPFEERILALTWYKQSFLSQDIKLDYSTIVNPEAFASFTANGITLYQGAESTDLYHEAWHNFTQRYLSKEEKLKIYEAVKAYTGEKSNLIDYEEALADSFKEFMIDDTKISIQGKNIAVNKTKKEYKGIIGFFKRMKDFITNIFGIPNAERILIDKYFVEASNIITSRTPDITNFLFRGTPLNTSRKFVDSDGTEINLDKRFVKEVLNNFDYMFVEEFKNLHPGIPFAVLSLQDRAKITSEVEDIYNGVYNNILDRAELMQDDDPRLAAFDIMINNFDEFVTIHSQNNNILSSNIIVKSVQEVDSIEDASKLEITEVYESMNSMELASENIINTIKLIPSMGKDGKLITTPSTGIPSLGNFYDNWTVLQKNLTGLSYDEMLDKLEELSIKYPQFQYLLSELPKTFDPKKLSSLIFRNQFVKVFSMPFVNIYNGVLRESDSFNYALMEAGTSSVKKVKDQWQINSIDGNNYREVVDESPRLSLNRLLEDFPTLPSNLDSTFEFLKGLGIIFTNPQEIKKAIGNPALNGEYKDAISRIYNKVVDLRRVSPLQSNIVEAIMREHKEIVNGKTKSINGENKALSYFASFEVSTNEEISSDMVIGASGSAIWKYTQYNYITKFTNTYKTKTVDEIFRLYPNLNPNKNPSIVQSVWFNTLFKRDVIGNYIKTNKNPDYIKVGGLSSSLVNRGEATVSLTSDDKLVYDFLSYFKSRKEELVRFGDKATTGAFVLDTAITQVEPKDYEKLIPFVIQHVIGEVLEINHLKNLYSKLKSNEISFMHDFHKKNLDKFIAFEWLDSDIKKDLLESTFTVNNGFVTLDKYNEGPQKRLYDRLYENIKSFTSKQGARIKTRLEVIVSPVEDFTVKDLIEDQKIDVGVLTNWYLLSSFLNRKESFDVLFGSLRNYKNGGDVFKRLSMYSATGDFPIGDKTNLAVMNAQYKRDIERLYSGKNREWSTEFTAVHFKKEPVSSPTASDEYYESIKDYINEYQKEELKDILKDYKDGEYADASGAVTLDFYRYLNISIGQWDSTQEEAYQKQVEFVKAKLDYEQNLISEDEFLDIKDEANELLEDLVVFNPKKWQYAGSIYTNEGIASMMDMRAFEKFSIQPLIPSVIDGKELENIAKSMAASGIDMYNFDSGSKLTWDNPSYDFVSVSKDENGTMFKSTTLDIHNFKEQLPVKNKFKDEGIFSSQMRKLLSLGLFEQGDEVGNPKAIEAYKRYKKAISDYTNALKKEIDSKIGTTEDLVQFIKEEFDKRDMPDYVNEFIETINGELKHNLDHSLHLFYTQNIVSSIINNRLVRQKLPGGQFIQVPNIGYKNANNKDINKYGRDDLQFYHINPETGEVEDMEIKIAFNSKWEPLLKLIHPDGYPIYDLDRLNEAIKDKDFIKEHGKKFTLVGCRIPVQGLNTMETMRVKEFLPPSSGQIVIVPAEITVKSGSDFDIDKLNIYEPQLDSKGNLFEEVSNFSEFYDNLVLQLKNNKETIDRFSKEIELAYASLTDEQREKLPQFRELRKALHEINTNNDYDLGIEFSPEEMVEAIKSGKNLFDVEKGKRIEDIKEILESDDDVIGTLEIISEYRKVIKDAKSRSFAIKSKLDNAKKGINNTLITSISEILKTPENYVSLITPNEVSILKNIYDNKKIGTDSFEKWEVLFPLTSLEAFDKYTVAKAALGIDAKMNTFYAMAMEAGLKIAKPSPSLFGRETSLSSKFTHKSNVIYTKNNQPIEISRFISEFISGHVDVAKDARIAEIKADRTLTPIYLYGVMRRVHPHDMVEFLTDPKVQALVKDLKDTQSITLNHIYKLKQETDKLDRRNIQKKHLLKAIMAENSPALSLKLSGSIDVKAISTEIIKTEGLSQGIKYLAEFIMMSDDTAKLKDLDTSLSHDTSNYKTFIEYAYPEFLFSEVVKDGFFEKDSLMKMKNESAIAPLRVSEYVKSKFSKYYTIISNPEFIKQALYTYNGASRVNIDKFSREFTNDFLTYLLQNLVDRNGINLYEKYIVNQRLLDRDNPNNIEQQINSLIKSLSPNDRKVITDNEFYKAIYFEKSTNSKDIKMFPRFKNASLDTFTKEILHEELQKLLNPTTTKNNNQIRNLFKILTNIVFLQAGPSQPLGSIISVLPTDTYTRMFSNMLENEKILSDVSVPNSDLWRRFIGMFKTRHSNYFPGATRINIEKFDKHNYFISKGKAVTLQEPMVITEREYTPENITELKPNEIFVFGSNSEGVHGKGAALLAKQKFGAIQKQSEGLQGQSYAIITKKNWRVEKSSTLNEIGKGIQDMLIFAKNNPDKKFLVTKLGSSLAGYTIDEIKELFIKLKNFIPDNVILPKEYEVRNSEEESSIDQKISESKEFNRVDRETILELAKAKVVNEYLTTGKVEYLNVPDNMSEEEVDDEYVNPKSKYWKTINTYNELINLNKKESNMMFDKNNETSRSNIIDTAIRNATTLKNNDVEIEGFDTFEEFISYINSSEIGKEFKDSANEIFKKYGLSKLTNEYNPSQLSLFEDVNTPILMSKEFNTWYLSELEKNPELTELEALEQYKACH